MNCAVGDFDRGYVHGLDALRGIAALLVALFHFDRWALPNLPLGPFDTLIGNGYIWVDFFFILSGFVMTHVYRASFLGGRLGAAGYREFLGARLARIYPLHFATLMMLVGLELVKLAVVLSGRVVENEPFTDRQSLDALVTNLLLMHGWNLHDDVTWNPPSWSISAEWAVYLVCPLVILALDKCRRGTGFLLVAGCVACLYALSYGRPLELDITYDLGVVRCLLGFMMGVVLHGFYRNGLPRWVYGDAALVLALAAGLLPMALDWPDALAVPGLAATVLVAAGNRGVGASILASALPVGLGRLSYSIYMCHVVIMAVVMDGWKFLYRASFGAGFTEAQSVAALAVLVGVTLACSWALYRRVEVPGRRLMRGWLLRRGTLAKRAEAVPGYPTEGGDLKPSAEAASGR